MTEFPIRFMSLEIASGLLISSAVALIFVQRSAGLFRRHVWVRAEGRIVGASIASHKSNNMSIEVRYQAVPDPSGPQAQATINQEFTKRFSRYESMWDKWDDEADRIGRVVGLDIDVWYAQAKPHECYLSKPNYFFRILKGIAGFAFGMALLGSTVYLAKFGPETVMDFMSWN